MKIILCGLDNNSFNEPETDVVRVIEISGCCYATFLADGEAEKKMAEHGLEWNFNFPSPASMLGKFVIRGLELKGHYESAIEILKKALGEDTKVDLSRVE